MNKTELVAAIAAKAGISKKDADAALSAFVDSIIAEIKIAASTVPAFKAGKAFKDAVK